MPEIIRPYKESVIPNQDGNNFPNFQEPNLMESSPSHTNHDIFCEKILPKIWGVYQLTCLKRKLRRLTKI